MHHFDFPWCNTLFFKGCFFAGQGKNKNKKAEVVYFSPSDFVHVDLFDRSFFQTL